MEWILSSYAHQLEIKRRFLRELGGTPRGIPRNLDDGLIRILQSNGPARDREAILKFYIKALPWTQCCWQIAYSEDKTIIDDTLRLARSMSDREKYGALKLVESLRRDRNKEMAKESLNLKRIEDIQVVFKLYENWWESALPLSEKLKLHPLEKSPYAWSPPG
ncbi:MAG: hypothetical protein B0A82_23900 [Alkalinema sp. CACIAM 70d]|nr:MAG: hypothetical protein B0A82_23900 [Alkalinema sp. CACIAM 70d]